MAAGGCHCGAIRYEVTGAPQYSALCHCSDCRKSAGATMVGWALFPEGQVAITGAPVQFKSSEHATRHFCGTCGTGLFYTNMTVFPGMIDLQTGTLDNQNAFPSAVHVQCAEAASWMDGADDLPKFDRYPAG